MQTHTGHEPVEKNSRIEHLGLPCRGRIQWNRLIFTDCAEPHVPRVDASKTVFMCFDSESFHCLQTAGFHVRVPDDYSIPTFSSYEDLYDYFSDSLTSDEKSILDASGEEENDSIVISDLLRCKAVEVYAPILYVWKIAEAVLAQEKPQSIEVHIEDRWLATVLNAFLSGRESLQG